MCFGSVLLDISLGSFCFGNFALEPSLGNVRVILVAWKLELDVVRLKILGLKLFA